MSHERPAEPCPSRAMLTQGAPVSPQGKPSTAAGIASDSSRTKRSLTAKRSPSPPFAGSALCTPPFRRTRRRCAREHVPLTHCCSAGPQRASMAARRRRLAVVMVRLKMAETVKEAVRFIEQGRTAARSVLRSRSRAGSGRPTCGSLRVLTHGSHPGRWPAAAAVTAGRHSRGPRARDGSGVPRDTVRTAPYQQSLPSQFLSRAGTHARHRRRRKGPCTPASAMEDFVTWVDTSTIRRKILKYNDRLDDYDLLA